MLLTRLLYFHSILVNCEYLYNNYNIWKVITRNLCNHNSKKSGGLPCRPVDSHARQGAHVKQIMFRSGVTTGEVWRDQTPQWQ